MKSNKEILDCLNSELNIELTSSATYTTHAARFKRWGYGKLYEHTIEEAKEEREHADIVLDRLLFLEGDVTSQKYVIADEFKTVEEIFDAQYKLETATKKALIEYIGVAEAVQDYITRDIFTNLLKPTEEQIYWLEVQRNLISQIGIQNYLQAQI